MTKATSVTRPLPFYGDREGFRLVFLPSPHEDIDTSIKEEGREYDVVLVGGSPAPCVRGCVHRQFVHNLQADKYKAPASSIASYLGESYIPGTIFTILTLWWLRLAGGPGGVRGEGGHGHARGGGEADDRQAGEPGFGAGQGRGGRELEPVLLG